MSENRGGQSSSNEQQQAHHDMGPEGPSSHCETRVLPLLITIARQQQQQHQKQERETPIFGGN